MDAIIIFCLSLLLSGSPIASSDWELIPVTTVRASCDDPGGAVIYPLQVDGFPPYIVVKETNSDGTLDIKCLP